MRVFSLCALRVTSALMLMLLQQAALSQTVIDRTPFSLPAAPQAQQEEGDTNKPIKSRPIGVQPLPTPKAATPLPPNAKPGPVRSVPTLSREKNTPIRLLAPNGGENIKLGSTFRIKWSGHNAWGSGSVELARNGRSMAVIARGVNLRAGAVIWKVDSKKFPQARPGGGYSIVLLSSTGDVLDKSDRVFSLVAAAKTRPSSVLSAAGGADVSSNTTVGEANTPSAPATPSFTITAPAAGIAWCTNEPHTFSWNSTLPATTSVKIDLMDANGQNVWRNISPSTLNSGSYLWSGLSDAQFPFGSGTFRPRISTLDNSVVKVGEHLQFGKRLVLSKPKSPFTWRKGSQYAIVWKQLCDLPSPLSIELLDSGHNLVTTIASGLSTSGSASNKSHMWTVPSNLNSGTYYMRVRTSGNEYTKENAFNIEDAITIPTSAGITITSPTTGTTWCTNEPHTFSWNSTLPATTNVKIDLMDANGQIVWRNITPSTLNSGSYLWSGLSDAQFPFGSGAFRPRVSTLDNAVLTVGEHLQLGKRLLLDKPKSPYIWRKGSQYAIVWKQLCDLPSPLSIELLDSGHNLVTTIASGLSASGSASNKTRMWTVPANLNSGTYYMRVRTSGNEYSRENVFTIDDALQF